jgi:hypothetical protein
VDLHPPAADGDLLDDEADQPLAGFEVELVEPGADALGEAGEPSPQALWRASSARCSRRACCSAASPSRRSMRAAERQESSVEVHDPRLAGVEEAAALALGQLELALEASQLRGEELVVGRWRAREDGALAGGELLRILEGAANLLKDEGVELIGADVALRATPLLAAGAQGVVVTAVVVVVVAVDGAVAGHASCGSWRRRRSGRRRRGRAGARRPARRRAGSTASCRGSPAGP